MLALKAVRRIGHGKDLPMMEQHERNNMHSLLYHALIYQSILKNGL